MPFSSGTVQRREENILPEVVLWGGGSQARIVNHMLLEKYGRQATVIYDSSIEKLPFCAEAVFINQIEKLRLNLSRLTHFIICIGNHHGYARHKTSLTLQRAGLEPLSLFHSQAFIDSEVSIGAGCLAFPGCVIHKFVEIGESCIINTAATIDHECRIGSGGHIMGSAAIAGRVTIGDYVTVGTNATILPDLYIGEGAIIGAGSVVTKNIDPYSVVAGVPARRLRRAENTQFNDDVLGLLDRA